MLETILIQNFQRHEKLRVDFDPKITTIVGDSDTGKSSILRALRWVLLNIPQGDGFIRHGSPGTTVQVLLDGRWIRRKRGKGVNSYAVDAEDFVAFGTEPPAPVAALANVTARNFQGQHDPHFLLAYSGGEVSRALNVIVDLGVIDEALVNVGRRLRSAQARTEVSAERLAASRRERDDLAWVPALSAAWDLSRATRERLQSVTAKAGRLHSLLTTYGELVAKNKGVSARIRDLTPVKAAFERLETFRETARMSVLRRLVADTQTATKASEKALPEIGRLSDLVERVKANRTRLVGLRRLVATGADIARDLHINGVKIGRLAADLEQWVGRDCPACGRPLTNPTLDGEHDHA